MRKKLRTLILILTLAVLAWPAGLHAEDEPTPEALQAKLLAGLKDPLAATRTATLRQLKAQGSKDPEIIAMLSAALTDTLADNRRLAAGALEISGASATSAAPALLAALKDKDLTVRVAALLALATVVQDQPTTSALAEILKDASPQLRVAALDGLRKQGAFAESALPAVLTAAVHEKHIDVCNALADYILEVKVLPGDATAALISMMRMGPAIRQRAIKALDTLGEKALTATIPCLISTHASEKREAASLHAAHAGFGVERRRHLRPPQRCIGALKIRQSCRAGDAEFDRSADRQRPDFPPQRARRTGEQRAHG